MKEVQPERLLVQSEESLRETFRSGWEKIKKNKKAGSFSQISLWRKLGWRLDVRDEELWSVREEVWTGGAVLQRGRPGPSNYGDDGLHSREAAERQNRRQTPVKQPDIRNQTGRGGMWSHWKEKRVRKINKIKTESNKTKTEELNKRERESMKCEGGRRTNPTSDVNEKGN